MDKPITASEMARRANAKRTFEEYQASAKKAVATKKKKYGKDWAKRVRNGKSLRVNDMEQEYLTLKWGTLKSWEFHSEKAMELLREYHKIGSSLSAALQHDTPRQKEIICALIDEGNFKQICLDWEGRFVSKKEAKKYVQQYGTKE